MLQTILGLAVFFFPCVLAVRCNDKWRAVAGIIIFMFLGHLAIAAVTQALHIFVYPVILMIHLIVVFFLGAYFLRHKARAGFSIDWVLIFVIAVSVWHLDKVHFNYTGKITTAASDGYLEVEHMQYPYPYYVDEWNIIALIKQSMEESTLPFKNPYIKEETRFLNFTFAAGTFISGIMMLLDFDPVKHYVLLKMFFSCLLCVLIYGFLRFENINKFSAAIAALSVLYVTNGANLPGMWTLIPVVLGMICMLAGFFFFARDDYRMMSLSCFAMLVFYPPLFPFFVIGFIVNVISNNDLPRAAKGKYLLWLYLAINAAIFLLWLSYLRAGRTADGFNAYVFTRLVYPTFPKNVIPVYKMWDVVPVPILVLSTAGLCFVRGTYQWLKAMTAAGLLYWLVYAFVTFRVVIDYQKVIFMTAVLIVVLSGFGLDKLIERLKDIQAFRNRKFLNGLQMGMLVLYIVFSFGYTQREQWRNLKLRHFDLNRIFSPAAPANRYFHPDDLKLFSDKKGVTFLSVPWKGTVIATMTGNYPASTKAGTITIDREAYGRFMRADCDGKTAMAASLKLDYVYTPLFSCPSFELLDKSGEGLFLYKVSIKVTDTFN